MALGLIRLLIVACALNCCLGARTSEPYRRTTSYSGQRVFSCQVTSASELANLTSDPRLDVWKAWRNEQGDHLVDVRTLSAQGESVVEEVAGRRCRVVIPDVEAWMKEQEASMFSAQHGRSERRVSRKLEWFDDYHPYEDIIAFYTALAASHPDLVTLTPSIGQSIELRPMPAVRITQATSPTAPKVLITCQIHAREWVSGSTCMFMAQQLVENFETNATVRELLSRAEVHILPFLNPDGYAYTWTGDRLWRKNRRVNERGNCLGVDLNRNFNIRWAEPGGGSSNNPCSEVYHGEAAESEPEIEHTVRYFKEHRPLVGGIDYHSYSQLILRPWGFTLDPPPHEAQLKAVGDGMEEVIRSVHGQTYLSQPGMDLYVTVGTSSDWYFSEDANEGNLGFRCAGYTIELRDTGRYGFILPPAQIIPTGQENYEGLVYFLQQFTDSPLPFP